MWHCKKKSIPQLNNPYSRVMILMTLCSYIAYYNPTFFFVLKSHLAFSVALGQMCQAAHTKCSPERHLAVCHWILIFWIQTGFPCISSPSCCNTARKQPLQDMCSFPQLHFTDHQHVVWQCATSEMQKQHRCLARSRSFSPSLDFTKCSCRG